MLDRFSHLGFVFFEDVNVDIRGDFSIAMTEVIKNNKKALPKQSFLYIEIIPNGQLSLRVLRVPFDIVNIVKYRVIS